MKRMWMALMFVPALALAQGWLFLGDLPDGRAYGREDSLVRPKVGNPVYWLYIDYNSPRGAALSARVPIEVDCSRQQTRALGTAEYAGQKAAGAQVTRVDTASEWAPVPPRTFAAGIVNRACS